MRKLLWLLFPFLISCEKTVDPRTLWHNRESVKMLNSKNLEASQGELIEAFQFDPYQPELHLNLGLNLELQKENEKALKQYATAEKYSLNAFQKFISRFNRAQLLAQEKKTEEALQEYQRALEIVPTSKEVKTNIELLMQQNQGQGNDKNNQDKSDEKNKGDDQSKDKKDGEGKDQQDPKDQQDKKDQEQKDKEQKNKDQQNKQYKPNSKYQPREFKGELSPGDVKKILDEIKQQEQKIRAEYNKKNDYKERPRDKDW